MRATLGRSVCVFCGSRRGGNPAHATAAAATGRALAEAGMRLVWGAGDRGLMGEVARAAEAVGGETLGVIPAHLVEREEGRGRFVVTETMHERKKVMLMNADALVALPGGAGTLDELVEALTWRGLGLHAKPVMLLNVAGYWEPLLGLLRHIVAEGFADAGFLRFLETHDSVPALVASLRECLPARPSPGGTDGGP